MKALLRDLGDKALFLVGGGIGGGALRFPWHQDTMDMANVIGFWPAAAVFLFLIAHLGVQKKRNAAVSKTLVIFVLYLGDCITQLYVYIYRDCSKCLQGSLWTNQ